MPARPATRSASSPHRTVDVVLTGPFEGWRATLKADFKARYWADLNSSDPDRFLPALDRIVVSHDFLDDETGGRAETLGDVDIEALTQMIERFGDEVGKLPPR